MKGEYKQHSEPGNEQYIITVKWPVYVDIRVEAESEDKACGVVEEYLMADSLYSREHAIEFECGDMLVLDMEVSIYEENMEIIEVEKDSPPRSLEGGE